MLMQLKLFLFRFLPRLVIICILFLQGSCKSKTKPYEPTYSTGNSAKKVLVFGVPTQSYYEIHDLLVQYLNKRLRGVQVQTVAAGNFLGYMEKLDQQYYDLTIVNGMKALDAARNGYTIFGQVIEENYAGAIVVNKDSLINTFSDLKGKTIATPGVPALAGHMLQMVYLSKKGIDIKKDINLNLLESFESVFLNVYLGKCSAGFSTINSWQRFLKRRPELSSKVTVKWITPPITGNAFVVRNDMDKKIADQLKTIILNMHANEEGKKALAKIGYLSFAAADTTAYYPVKNFLKVYDSLVGDYKQ